MQNRRFRASGFLVGCKNIISSHDRSMSNLDNCNIIILNRAYIDIEKRRIIGVVFTKKPNERVIEATNSMSLMENRRNHK